MLKSPKVKIVEKRITTASTGLSSGSVTCQKRLPRARTVDLRGLVVLARHRHEPGQRGDGKEGESAPHVDHDHRDHRVGRLAQPVGAGRR